ncbi:MAG: PEP-CTERM sorting domain-containing protein [Sphingomonadaceae bacterium]
MLRTLAIAALAATVASPASATILVVFDDFDGGFASFAATVTAAGGTQTNFVLPDTGGGAPYVTPDFSIARNDGGFVSLQPPYDLFFAVPPRTTTGGVIDISPSGTGPGIGAKGSGITFTFTTPINALGFEVGDWATCCQPSDLYIQFGSNAPIKVGASTVFGDQFLTNGGAGVFVAAFDDTDEFTTVSFWGDGFGEYLVIGGTIRYALLDRGSLPTPAPAALALFGLGVAALGLARRR